MWRRNDLPGGPAPVLIFVPGGAWVVGSRALQGHALMAHLVELGWVCVSVQYRASPRHRWPSHITDVKTAIAWTRTHIAGFGGDPNFIAIAGCSAGGHLANLAGLTPNDAGHGFDLLDGSRTAAITTTIGLFLAHLHQPVTGSRSASRSGA